MKAYEKISQTLDIILKSQKEINDILCTGPASFYVEQLELYMDTLFNRFAPFKVGSKVRLTKDIGATLKKSSGWYSSRQMLCKGATGVVKDVDITNDRKFRAGVVFDNDFIFVEPDKIVVTDRDRRGTFYISEDSLEEI